MIEADQSFLDQPDKNWIAKNGLPAVFSCITSASGPRALGQQ